jgi:hypothetical protein
MDVTVVSGKAYLASAMYGLSVVNVTTPSVPKVTGTSNIVFAGDKIALSGTKAVVTSSDAAGMAHLWVLNVNPNNPAGPFVTGDLGSSIPIGEMSGFKDVAINSSATMAVVAAGLQGVWVVDLTDPSTPKHIFTYDTPGTAYGIALDSTGTLAYVADGSQGLQILNVSLTAAPTLAGYKTLSGHYMVGVTIVNGGKTACLLNQMGTLDVFDVSIPSAPKFLAGKAQLGSGVAITGSGTRAAVLSANMNYDFVEIFEISTPTNPGSLGSATVGTSGSSEGLSLDNSYVYVAAGSDGLKIYNISPTPALQYPPIKVPGDAYDVTVKSPYVYVTGYPAAVSIIDLQLP